jgi:4-hydroxy-tetrahydrodipicolinate synthase
MAVGAEGVISVASNEIPKLMRQLVDTRDVALQNRLLPLLTGNFIEANPGPVKAAMKMMGILESDTLRPPLAPLTEASRTKLDAILRECGLKG